ncbi:carbon storage regulator [Lysobacter enzymogenes]|uniref:carbon storage regulator n=1 Tax=Lysobacter enzymogenes TaxID=69 RepID=UPI00374869B4
MRKTVVTRSPCDAIRIGDDIEVRVFRVRNGHVRFGLTAPSDVLILRSELLENPRRAEIPWCTSKGKKAARRIPPGSTER